jgi:hypothetical protein
MEDEKTQEETQMNQQAAPVPVFDEDLLDELARIFARAALDELMKELEESGGDYNEEA